MQTQHKTSRLVSNEHTPLYASQSSDFIPLHFGGLNLTPQAKFKQASRGYQNNLFKNQHNRRNQSFGSYARRDKNAPKNRFQRPFDGETKNYNKQQYKNELETREQIVSQYFHTSMLEDPWKELLERHNALNRSINNTSDEENEDEPKVIGTSYEVQ